MTINRSPGRFIIPLWLLWLMLPMPGAATSVPGNDSSRALQLLREIDDLYRSASAASVLTMQVKTAHYSRTVIMEGWSKGKDKSLVRITSPRKEKGTATLKSASSIYTYLPKTDRTVRLTSGMMMGSWMGSHFTNDDLVKESRLAEDYEPAITFEGERRGEEVIEFTLTPLPEAPVVWGRIVITLRQADHLPITSLYYDEEMVLVRTLTFSHVSDMGGRLIPTVLRIVPADKKEEYTELTYNSIRFDVELDDSLFSLQHLRRR